MPESGQLVAEGELTTMSRRGVLLIGASSPIGQAIADRFADAGDVVVGVSVQPCDHPRLRVHIEADCATEAGARQAVDTVLDVHGRLDVIVLAAAVQPHGAVTDLPEDKWAQTVNAVLTSAYQVCRRGLPHLRPGSAVVAVSSVNAHVAAPGLPSYAAAKAGLEGLMRQLALEYGPHGIRANTVVPGIITTDPRPELAEGYPLRRVGRADEVASAVHYLASPDASFITGVSLPIDGGLMIASPSAFARPDLRAKLLGDNGTVTT